ncbi:MAG: hypothetical protein U0790_26155 [Isosphaeraceae bacterium]
MNRRKHPRNARPGVESLEGRALLSGLNPSLDLRAGARAALVKSLEPRGITTDPAGVQAIMNALSGGLGREWVSLIRSKVRNVGSIVSGFVSGRINAYSIPGLTVRTPAVQPLFVGRPYDQLLPTAAGAAVFRSNVMELGAIMRGPFHNPDTSYYVWGFNRGAGAGLGPIFASRPGITPDLLVTLTVGPFGSSATGKITDLANNTSQDIPSSNIQIRGPVVRVFLNANQFPSAGLPLQKYRFAFWTQTQPGRDIATVPSFAPDASMIPIGVLKRVSVTR